MATSVQHEWVLVRGFATERERWRAALSHWMRRSSDFILIFEHGESFDSVFVSGRTRHWHVFASERIRRWHSVVGVDLRFVRQGQRRESSLLGHLFVPCPVPIRFQDTITTYSNVDYIRSAHSASYPFQTTSNLSVTPIRGSSFVWRIYLAPWRCPFEWSNPRKNQRDCGRAGQ